MSVSMSMTVLLPESISVLVSVSVCGCVVDADGMCGLRCGLGCVSLCVGVCGCLWMLNLQSFGFGNS